MSGEQMTEDWTATVSTCEEAARRWDGQALELRDWAAYQRSRGASASATEAKAALAEAAAESLRLEDRTGTAHCVCCLKPVTVCRKYATGEEQ